MAQQAKAAKLRRKLGKEIRPLFSGAKFDVEKIDTVLAGHSADMQAALRQEQTGAAKRMAPLAKTRALGIANTRAALEEIRFKPYVTTTIPLTTPFLIWATPIGMLHDSHVEPWNNWAKFTYSSDKDTGDASVVVNFYFAWQNTANYLAVLNCDTDVIANGIIEATAEQGWLSPGESWLELQAKLTVFFGATEVNWQGTQTAPMGSVTAEGGWAEIGGSGDLDADPISSTYHLSATDIQVPANEMVIFEVACMANWWIDGGSIVLDFDFDPANYSIMCPALTIHLLTPPAAV